MLSVAQICDAGGVVVFDKREATILQKETSGNIVPVMKIPHVQNLYKLNMDEKSADLNISSQPDDAPEVNKDEVRRCANGTML